MKPPGRPPAPIGVYDVPPGADDPPGIRSIRLEDPLDAYWFNAGVKALKLTTRAQDALLRWIHDL